MKRNLKRKEKYKWTTDGNTTAFEIIEKFLIGVESEVKKQYKMIGTQDMALIYIFVHNTLQEFRTNKFTLEFKEFKLKEVLNGTEKEKEHKCK